MINSSSLRSGLHRITLVIVPDLYLPKFYAI